MPYSTQGILLHIHHLGCGIMKLCYMPQLTSNPTTSQQHLSPQHWKEFTPSPYKYSCNTFFQKHISHLTFSLQHRFSLSINLDSLPFKPVFLTLGIPPPYCLKQNLFGRLLLNIMKQVYSTLHGQFSLIIVGIIKTTHFSHAISLLHLTLRLCLLRGNGGNYYKGNYYLCWA